MLLSLLDELFLRYLSVRDIGRLVISGQIVKLERSLLCKEIGRKNADLTVNE